MKITMYELLGMIKDGKLPKIKFNNNIYEYHDKEHGYCRYYHDNTYICLNTDYYLFDILNDEVEILEEEKKIPEKLDLYEETQNIVRENNYKLVYHDIHKCIVSLECKYNQLIDYLKIKGDE